MNNLKSIVLLLIIAVSFQLSNIEAAAVNIAKNTIRETRVDLD